MKRYAILVDSGSQIEIGSMDHVGIFVVPLQVIIEDKAYNDQIDISSDEVFKRMAATKCLASTSQPTQWNLENTIDKIIGSGYDCILALPIASGLSATGLNIMATCKQKEIEVIVVDTKSTASNQRYLAGLARELLESNKDIKEVVEILKNKVERSGTLVMAPNLEHLKRSGRITPGVAILANMMKIVPVMKLEHNLGGKIDILSKVRTVKRANRIIVENMVNNHKINNTDFIIAVQHVHAIELANEAKQMIINMIGECAVEVRELPAVVGAHLGIGGVGYQFIEK